MARPFVRVLGADDEPSILELLDVSLSRFGATVVCILLVATTACSDSREPPPPSSVPSEREAAEFAKTFAELLKTCDASAIRKTAFDEDLLFLKSFDGFRTSANARAEARRGTAFVLDQYVDSVIQSAKSRKLRFLKVREIGGERRLLFRTVLEDLSGKYDEFQVIRKSGRVRISDATIYSMGGRLSDMIRETNAASLVTSGEIESSTVPPDVQEFASHGRELKSMRAAFEKGAFGDAMKLYAKLPASLRERRSLLFMRIKSVPKGAVNDLADALADLERLHRDDFGAILLLLQDPRLMQDLPRALELTERLDKAIGGDPYIHMHRFHAHLWAGDMTNAALHLRNMIDADPGCEETYRMLLGISLAQKDFQAIPKLLDVMEPRFGWKPEDLHGAAAWLEFVKSDDYEEWMRRKKGK